MSARHRILVLGLCTIVGWFHVWTARWAVEHESRGAGGTAPGAEPVRSGAAAARRAARRIVLSREILSLFWRGAGGDADAAVPGADGNRFADAGGDPDFCAGGIHRE